MTRPEQKAKELRIVQEYVKKKGWDAQLSPGAEPPDVLIKLADGSELGVEVIEYFQPWLTVGGHTLRQTEAAWREVRRYVVEYRRQNSGLENLSVVLEFSTHDVPRRDLIPAFVQAVANRIRLETASSDDKRLTIELDATDDPLIRQFLRCIRVRRVDVYLEWDWNHSVGHVGTSDSELVGILKRKLGWKPPPNLVATFHLVVAGDGPDISQVMAPFSAEQLNSFSVLNGALENGPYEEVALLSQSDFLWVRGVGWRSF